MKVKTTSLLPNVLDLLSQEPDLSSSIDDLCKQLKDVTVKDVISPLGSLQSAVEYSIELGINIGILSRSEQNVFMLFGLKPTPSKKKKNTSLSPTECRSLIKRLVKTVKANKSKLRASAKARSKSKKATLQVGATGRPLPTRAIKKRGTMTTRRRKQ
ncbi:hypothetical protein ACLKA7_001428 [Drosophila subpalustris]